MSKINVDAFLGRMSAIKEIDFEVISNVLRLYFEDYKPDDSSVQTTILDVQTVLRRTHRKSLDPLSAKAENFCLLLSESMVCPVWNIILTREVVQVVEDMPQVKSGFDPEPPIHYREFVRHRHLVEIFSEYIALVEQIKHTDTKKSSRVNTKSVERASHLKTTMSDSIAVVKGVEHSCRSSRLYVNNLIQNEYKRVFNIMSKTKNKN